MTSKDRWRVFTAVMQAAAPIGTFLAALPGFWKLWPIVAHQKPREARALQLGAVRAGESDVDRFGVDAVSWWGAQFARGERILELTGVRTSGELKVGFEVANTGATSIAPAVAPGLPAATTLSPRGGVEAVKVPVNDEAMPPSQHLRCCLNQGVFAGLDAADRAKAGSSVRHFIGIRMLPRVSPADVRQDISLAQELDEIARAQGQRVEALQHLLGPKTMLDGALRESRTSALASAVRGFRSGPSQVATEPAAGHTIYAGTCAVTTTNSDGTR